VEFLHFLGILTKIGFFRFFSAKIIPYAKSSLYCESAQKTIPENIHFVDLWVFRGNLGRKVGWIGVRFI
jgi:hypothetical protein